MLKVIIHESDVDTQATAVYIRQQLASLDEYMGTIDSDIKKFNVHVKSLIRDLERRRQTSTDILTNLFKGYKAASDKTFVEYILRKEEEYEEGTILNPDQLMNLAANKYKIRLRKGEWNAPTAEESKIIALQAKVLTLEKGVKTKKGKDRQNKKSEGKKGGGDNKQKDKPAWMTKPPTKTEKDKSKTVDKKEYWWCDALKAWCRHHPSKCRAKGAEKKPKSDTKKLRFSKALESVIDESDEDDSE